MLNSMNGTPTGRSDRAPDSDEELVSQATQAAEGDFRAFEELVMRYQKRVVANCRSITRDVNNAEDLAQEVLVKVFFGLRGFEKRSSFGHWLKRIKINHCLNHLKKNSQSFVDVGDPETSEFEELKVKVTAEGVAGAMGEKKLISSVLESMPHTLRIPLVLCDMDELSYEEVAKSLGIGLSATKMRIKRARQEFRIRYEKARSMSTIVGKK
ncbi:MAG: sigma-70 family RNA polymerase sigma factor [Acidobacteriaceae bacterium]|nr:sigma-70 family RNA polymerase sigma factor [Acidobacteriaceae bacterium]